MPHSLIYSTHSHYMINPHWLEQTYIVQNEPVTASSRMIDSANVNDDTVKVEVIPYRQFVTARPNQTSYFQPVVDRLAVTPSKFDINAAGIIVEGKSDYYILEYFNRQYFDGNLRLYPALGAGTLSALIALLRGWGTPVKIVLDSDKAGQKELATYQDRFNLSPDEIKLLDEFFPGSKKIENLFTSGDLQKMGIGPGKSSTTKKQVLFKFQENLAAGLKIPLTTATVVKIKSGLKLLNNFGESAP